MRNFIKIKYRLNPPSKIEVSRLINIDYIIDITRIRGKEIILSINNKERKREVLNLYFESPENAERYENLIIDQMESRIVLDNLKGFPEVPQIRYH